MSCTGNVSFLNHRLVRSTLPLDDHPNAVTTARQMKRDLFTWHVAEFIGIAEHKRSGGLLLIGKRCAARQQCDNR